MFASGPGCPTRLHAGRTSAGVVALLSAAFALLADILTGGNLTGRAGVIAQTIIPFSDQLVIGHIAHF